MNGAKGNVLKMREIQPRMSEADTDYLVREEQLLAQVHLNADASERYPCINQSETLIMKYDDKNSITVGLPPMYICLSGSQKG